MPYVQGFNNDIFISFAHTDDTDGWVRDFHARLEARLAQLGISVCIWRDTKLQGTDVFSDEIFDRLKSSALLVSIISPAGVNSSWCQDERQKFEQFAALNGGFRIKNTLRAIKVVKTPLDNDEHRDLFGTLGFEFYERDKQSQVFQEFDPTSPTYRQMLDRLAQDIRRALLVLCDRDVSAAPQLSVYVAATSSDLEKDREAIVRQIDDWGYAVLPASASGLAESPDLRSRLEADIGKSILSVHLVSKQRGVIPEGEDKSIVALQYDLAQSRPVDRIVWISPGSQPDQSVSKSIEEGREQGVEVLEGRSIDDLKELIEAKLKRLSEESPLVKEGRTKFNVYMICDRKDHPYLNEAEGRQRALQLKSYLDNQGYVVWLPPVTPMEETRRRKDHRETLKLSDAVLIYWGAADEVWFRESLRDLIKARTRRSGSRYLAEAAFFGSPQLSEKSQYRNQLDLVFEQFEDFNPDVLKPLFQRLQ